MRGRPRLVHTVWGKLPIGGGLGKMPVVHLKHQTRLTDMDRARRIVQLRDEGLTLRDVGSEFDLSYERVRQILLVAAANGQTTRPRVTAAELASRLNLRVCSVHLRAKKLSIKAMNRIGFTEEEAERIRLGPSRPSRVTVGMTFPYPCRLTIVERGPDRKTKRHRYRTWWCRCSCGTERYGPVFQENLLKGRTTSCGCRRQEYFDRGKTSVRKETRS